MQVRIHIETWDTGWKSVLSAYDAQGQLVTKQFGAENLTIARSRIDLVAAIKSIEALKAPVTIQLYCDSAYVVMGLKSRLKAWMENGWKTKDNQPVKNQDLWKMLHEKVQIHTLEWEMGPKPSQLDEPKPRPTTPEPLTAWEIKARAVAAGRWTVVNQALSDALETSWLENHEEVLV